MAPYGQPSSTVHSDQVRAAIAEAKTLIVSRLKEVLRQENLPVSGVKNELQYRLIDYIESLSQRGEHERIQRVQGLIRGRHLGPYPSPTTSYSGTTHTPYAPQYGSFNSPHANSVSPLYLTNNSQRLHLPPIGSTMPAIGGYSSPRQVQFKSSPFYEIKSSVVPPIELKAREQTRDTARAKITFSHDQVQELQANENLRIMVFCAAESFEPAWKQQDIAFPHHAELKVNQEDVKANLKGMKNKPGTTRPVDITPLLSKRAGRPNDLEVIYALTTKKYNLCINFVERVPMLELLRKSRSRHRFTKDRVIAEMRKEAADEDLVVDQSKISLRDPVQMTKITTPSRGLGCKHIGCFDTEVYLTLQQQAPTWTCPLCSRPLPWEQLAFDEFMDDILKNTPANVEQIVVEPDGRWHIDKVGDDEDDESNPRTPKPEIKAEAESINLIELESPQPETSLPMRSIHGNTSSHNLETPSSHSALEPQHNTTVSYSFSPKTIMPSPSLAQPSSQSRPSVQKRKHDEIIDLTFSDDEDEDDEPPVSRVKRPSMSSTLSDSVRRFPGPSGQVSQVGNPGSVVNSFARPSLPPSAQRSPGQPQLRHNPSQAETNPLPLPQYYQPQLQQYHHRDHEASTSGINNSAERFRFTLPPLPVTAQSQRTQARIPGLGTGTDDRNVGGHQLNSYFDNYRLPRPY